MGVMGKKKCSSGVNRKELNVFDLGIWFCEFEFGNLEGLQIGRFRRASEFPITENQNSFRVDFQRSEEEEPRFVSFGWASEDWKNGKSRFVSIFTNLGFGWASKDRKNPKIHKFGGLLKNENPKIRSSGSLWSLEKVEPRFVLVRVVFRKSEEPRFVRVISDEWMNQDSFGWTSEEWKT
ncbi:unnamed protein product [Rhizophagus irregularis]|nr:unnamed protein product [Rhizophagus irregularis]